MRYLLVKATQLGGVDPGTTRVDSDTWTLRSDGWDFAAGQVEPLCVFIKPSLIAVS